MARGREATESTRDGANLDPRLSLFIAGAKEREPGNVVGGSPFMTSCLFNP